jgi:hypothetical protein
VAYQTTRRPVLLAQAGGVLAPLLLDAYRLVLGSVASENPPNPAVTIVEVKDLGEFAHTRPEPPFAAINTFARPVLVAHGWDHGSILRDSELLQDPLADERYGQILRDLVVMTNAVYRPIWLTYNSRISVVPNGQALAEAFRRLHPDGPPESPLLADPNLHPGSDQSPKGFRTFDSFGFSMGGLITRTYQLGSFYADPPLRLPGESRRGRLQRMVTMGTPHHGALQDLRNTVALGSTVLGVPVESLLRTWSPGTADLLDYFDSRFVPCAVSRNRTLCELNRERNSGPEREISLIAGTKSTIRIADGFDFDLGPALIGPLVESDGIVPLFSAHGEDGANRRVVPALTRRQTFEADFDHLNAGTDATGRGEGDQRITLFADTAILPTLQDHWVIREKGLVEDEPIFGPGLRVLQCPTSTEPGRIEANISFDWKATNGGLTGIAIATYAEDAEGEWHILHGADPGTGELDSRRLLSILGNSVAIPPATPELRRIRFDQPLPAGIDARRTMSLFISTGDLSPSGGRAPLRPSEAEIERAEASGRIQTCP